MRPLTETFELAGTPTVLDVPDTEYVRLLGYPRGWELEGRARELADWARGWYAANGRPWFYARQAESVELNGDSILLDGVAFAGKRLRNTIEQAEAHGAIVAAVGAGPEAEEESRLRWESDRPDEYFFLEVFASAVVEHLTTLAGARLCDWAEQQGMAVLPHDSPGYPNWDVAEQPRLLALLKQTRGEQFPSQVEALDSGMLRPKKSQLAVFGVTRHTEWLRRLTGLVPCERCSFGPCQYRRAPYRRAPRTVGEPLAARVPMLDREAAYSVNRRALQKWSEEHLSIQARGDGSGDGSIAAVFRYNGTTCTNTGRPLAFEYHVLLGPRAEGYPIREQRCAPAPGDAGHTAMCKYIEDSGRLMAAIEQEKPLQGESLNAVLSWQRKPSAAGCYCESSSREHKWGLVLETIHYALVQRELAQEMEPS
ncbi:MAG: hypothetical protein ACRD3N_13055 [Terracidiphilus sp.]